MGVPRDRGARRHQSFGDVTDAVARHLAGTNYQDLSDSAVRAAKWGLMDSIGVMVAAQGMDSLTRRLSAVVEHGAGPSPVVGAGWAGNPGLAANLNGVAVQALDFSDTIDETGHHPSAQTVPAALALAHRPDLTGLELLTAIALGQDLGARLSIARSANARSFDSSPWFPGTVFGPFSAIAAAGKVAGLDHAGFVNALGYAYHRAHGRTEWVTGPRSDLRAVRYGAVASDAVAGVDLVRAGVRVQGDAVESLLSNFFPGGAEDAARVLDGIGEEYLGSRAALKIWPACRATHGFIGGLRSIARTSGVAPGAVASVRLWADDFTRRKLGWIPDATAGPESSTQAKNCLPFVAALAVLRNPALKDFHASALRDPDVLLLAARVEVLSSNEARMIAPVSMEVELVDGTTLRRDVAVAPGGVSSVSERDVTKKFQQCLAHGRPELDSDQATRLADVILNLETPGAVAELRRRLP